MNIRSEIITQFKQVAEEQGLQLETLTDNLTLLDSGLDSLCFAMIVARLEIQLETDPFSTSEDITFPVTFGEFVHFYENAAKQSSACRYVDQV
jgi:aryl carrier-like protein